MPGLSDFLRRLVEEGRAPNTVSAYRSDIAAYERWRAAVSGRAGIEAYVDALTATGRKPASITRALVAIRAYHRFLEDDIVVAVQAPAIPPSEPEVLDEAEVAVLLRTAEDHPRDHAMLAVLVGGGLRISELIGLDVGHVGQAAVVVVGHGERDRVAPLDERATRSLGRWLTERPRAIPAVFVNARGGRLSRQGAWGIVHARGERAGLGGRVTPEVLRHSFAARPSPVGACPG